MTTEPFPLEVGGRTIVDATDHVRRYTGLPWSGGPPEVWAFGYYDAIPTAHDNHVTPIDVVCTAALHPTLRRTDLEFFVRRRDDLAGWLAAVPHDQQLWEADEQLLAHLDSLVEFDPEVPLTLLTKVLHRKRPSFVPLLDRHVIDFYRQPGDSRQVLDAWPNVVRRIREDLATPEQRLLIAVAIPSVHDNDGETIPISLLRFIDIAIWMQNR